MVKRVGAILTFNEGIVEPVVKVIYPDFKFRRKEWVSQEQLFLVRGFQPPLLNVKPRSQFKMNYKITNNYKNFIIKENEYKDCVEIIGNGQTEFIADTRSGPIQVSIKNIEVICDEVGLVKQERFENTNASAFGNMSLKKELISFE